MSRPKGSSRRRRAAALTVILAIGIVTLLAIETHRRDGLYWFDVTADYRYSFEGDGVGVHAVEVTEDGFVWPGTGDDWDTAYLRLEVSTTLASRWFEPSIEVRGPGGEPSRQVFERGARGVRYVEIGPGGPDAWRGGSVVALDGRHLRWEPQRAELLTFRNPSLDGRSILVVAPHPDDAEIAAFGTYAGRDAWVVTVTAGNHDDGRYDRLAATSEERDELRGRIRAWDSVVVPAWGGVPPARSIQLGYRNGSLRRLHDGRTEPEVARIAAHRRFNAAPGFADRPVDPTWDGLVDDLVAVLETARPEIIVTAHPALDISEDHRFATWALFDALDRIGADDGWLLMYTNHLVFGEHYPFGPADARVTLPVWLDPELPVRSVLSRSLDERTRLEKLFALEAMHDLRAAPNPILGVGPVRRGLDRVASAVREVLRDPAGTYDYLRRAPRPNEVFLVSTWADRTELRAYVDRAWPIETGTPDRGGYPAGDGGNR